MEPFYAKEGDVYHYVRKSVTDVIGKEIAIGFSVLPVYESTDPEDQIVMMHRHGRREVVEKWFDESIKKMAAAGVKGFATDLKVLISSEIDPEDLNTMLLKPSHLGSWLRTNKIEV